jgi:hypothetical protein
MQSGITMLAADWRVRPLDHLQWVLEVRKKARDGRLRRDGEVWRAYAYCRTKAGLETALSRLRCEGIVLDPALLAGLLDFFPEPGEASPVAQNASALGGVPADPLPDRESLR